MDDRYHRMREPEPSRERSWILPNLVVQVGEEGLGAFIGIIHEAPAIDDGMCLVALYDSNDGEHVVVSPSEVKMVRPHIMDDVKIVKGKFRHMTGQLVDIRNEGQHGLVLFDSINQMKFVKMEKIGKLAYMREPATTDEGESESECDLRQQEKTVQQKSCSDSIGSKDEFGIPPVREENDPSPKAEGECSLGISKGDEGSGDGSGFSQGEARRCNSEPLETENVTELLQGGTESYCSLGETRRESPQREEHHDQDDVSRQNQAQNSGCELMETEYDGELFQVVGPETVYRLLERDADERSQRKNGDDDPSGEKAIDLEDVD